ncbi:hypothetical protein BXZ70DRAFT_960187 [Cristinia sonorae]|uniref:Fungal-type protein kinase domain-containing protein n=1 Tax=Cristinia sonorae TaxID=1940300 RepID=A0A8K0UE78_9AGAR|nr:hypothetical protein BXZ70DRAFT_960187 [Cristinia sonorae]
MANISDSYFIPITFPSPLPPGYPYWCHFHISHSDTMSDTHHTNSLEEEERDVVLPLPQRQRPLAASDVAPERDTTPPPFRFTESESTPFRASMGAATKSNTGYMDPDVKAFLKNHFKGTVNTGIPIHKFFRDVWKLDIGNLHLKEESSFTVQHTLLKRFLKDAWKKTIENKHVRTEGTAAIAFHQIWKHLEAQLPPLKDHTAAIFHNMQEHAVHGEFAELKPDFNGSHTLESDLQHCIATLYCGEMKKYLETRQKNKYNVTIEQEALKAAYSGHVDSMKTNPQKKRPRGVDSDGDDPADLTYPNKRAKTTKKTSSSSVGEGRAQILEEFSLDGEIWGKENVRRSSDLTGNQLQIAKYLNELLSHGVRSYATGFLLEQTNMTLWYADRMGLVSSQSFDIFRKPEYLLLVIAAHHYGAPHDFGVNPFLTLPPDTSRFISYDKMILTLPSATSANLPPRDGSESPDAVRQYEDALGPSLPPLEFQVDLSDNRHINTAYGTIGRGTTVVPVLARGTAQELFGPGHLVAKLAWPIEHRDPEDKFVRVIRRKMDEKDQARPFLKHIVELKCSFSCRMDDPALRFPRAALEPEPVADDMRRCFRVLMMPEYLPLEEVKSPEELRQVFIDVITGHHWVYETSNVLHRDISHGNIMFYRVRDGDNEKVVGVLTDWDLAEKQEGDGVEVSDAEIQNRMAQRDSEKRSKASPADPTQQDEDIVMAEEDEASKKRQKARYRTGTGPFMAVELLQPGPTPRHLYRHDLESFFWVLAWFCAVFNPKDPHNLRVIPAWQQKNLVDVGSAKSKFLTNNTVFQRTFAQADPAYLRFKLHLAFLSSLFRQVKREAEGERENAEDYFRFFDATTPEPEVEVIQEECLAKLKECRERLRDLVTFEKVLGMFSRELKPIS